MRYLALILIFLSVVYGEEPVPGSFPYKQVGPTHCKCLGFQMARMVALRDVNYFHLLEDLLFYRIHGMQDWRGTKHPMVECRSQKINGLGADINTQTGKVTLKGRWFLNDEGKANPEIELPALLYRYEHQWVTNIASRGIRTEMITDMNVKDPQRGDKNILLKWNARSSSVEFSPRDYIACMRTEIRIYQEVQKMVEDMVIEVWSPIYREASAIEQSPRETVPAPKSQALQSPAKSPASKRK